MSELPSGTVTFLFTDLEGSTRLWEHQPDAMQGALARHDASLHVLAVFAAEAGFREEARALTEHSVASGGTFAMMGEPVAWLTDRLAHALGDRTGPPPSSPMHRRDLMALVGELEVLLASSDASAP